MEMLKKGGFDMGFVNHQDMLVITHATPSENGLSILQWHPFINGNTLDEIITSYNYNCFDAYKNYGWRDDLIREIGKGINVRKVHISEKTKLREDDFKKIDFILYDLDTMYGEANEKDKKYISTLMASQTKPYQLLRLTRNKQEVKNDFEPLACRPINIYSQKDLEDFLIEYCEMCRSYNSSSAKANSVDLTDVKARYVVGKDIIQSISERTNKLVYVDTLMNLSEHERVALANQAEMKDFKFPASIKKVINQTFGPTLSKEFLEEFDSATFIPTKPENELVSARPRNFVLRDKAGNEIGVFSGKQPRQAALKAANRGFTDIRLRERGTKKIHIFIGYRKQVDKPANAPNWMPQKIWKPKVRKIGIDKLEKI